MAESGQQIWVWRWIARLADLDTVVSNATGIGSGAPGHTVTGIILFVFGGVLGWLKARVLQVKDWWAMPLASNWMDWTLLCLSVALCGLGLALVFHGRGRRREELVKPAKEVVQENNVTPKHSPLLVVLMLHRHRDLATSQLLHRLIQSGEELRQWKAEFRQWRQNVERDLRRYCSPSDVEYFRAQEQVPSVTFASDFRSPSYGHQHGLDRTVLSRWINVLQELIDKYEKE